ncbi:MAG: bacillithiol system redox-active protein YtxJ [Bacteroidota bacterium]
MSSWQSLTQPEQLAEIDRASHERPQLIFKHSISCGISAQAQYQLQSATDDLAEGFDLHYLDLINHRPASNEVAAHWKIPHQSPQVLIIKDGEVVYHASHFGIRPANIIEAA